MPDAKSRAAESIVRAKEELDRALVEVEGLRTLDPGVVGLVAHAVSHYITVTTATVEMLQLTLRDYRDPNVAAWLDGIAHGASLMQHFVGRLVEVTAPRDFPLKPDYVNLDMLVRRSCEYFRRRAQPLGVAITLDSDGTMPLVWGDRVALALILSDLLSNAVAMSPNGSTVRVRLARESGHVTCEIRDAGSGETSDQPQLALAREFVARLDGDLRSEPQPGQGTSWSFRLPALEK